MIETFSPKAPSNLTANSTKEAITIRWTQNYIRPDLKFSIWYRLSDSQEWRTHQVRFNNKMESTIENLEPAKEYEFMVLSQDRYNDGLFSKAFRYRTKCKWVILHVYLNLTLCLALDYDEPEDLQGSMSAFSQIGPPRNLSVIEVPGGFFVCWDAPDYGQDMLGLYIIRFDLLDLNCQGKHPRNNFTFQMVLGARTQASWQNRNTRDFVHG